MNRSITEYWQLFFRISHQSKSNLHFVFLKISLLFFHQNTSYGFSFRKLLFAFFRYKNLLYDSLISSHSPTLAELFTFLFPFSYLFSILSHEQLYTEINQTHSHFLFRYVIGTYMEDCRLQHIISIYLKFICFLFRTLSRLYITNLFFEFLSEQ